MPPSPLLFAKDYTVGPHPTSPHHPPVAPSLGLTGMSLGGGGTPPPQVPLPPIPSEATTPSPPSRTRSRSSTSTSNNSTNTSGKISPTSIMSSSAELLSAASASTTSLVSLASTGAVTTMSLNDSQASSFLVAVPTSGTAAPPTTAQSDTDMTPARIDYSGKVYSSSSTTPGRSVTKISIIKAGASAGSSSSSVNGRYDSFESCMEGGVKHETQSATTGRKDELSERQLVRAAALFATALSYKPSSAWARLRRGTVLLHLSHHAPPSAAIAHLREARGLLLGLAAGAPHSTSAREALAAVCSRLSVLLHARDDSADDPVEVWEGEVGRFACEALEALEEVAAERMDRARILSRESFETEAPALADMFIALAESAGAVAALATDADTVDEHTELAEHALDQAANMATLAAAAKVRPASVAAALITRVQLASGSAAAERLRNMFLLGVAVDEDDFAALIADMTLLVNETRERGAKLKGSKGAAAALQAFEAMRQLGDTKVLYANILRCVWRGRQGSTASSSMYHHEPSTPGCSPALSRCDSGVPPLERSRAGSLSASSSIDSPPIPELPEPEDDEDETDSSGPVDVATDLDPPTNLSSAENVSHNSSPSPPKGKTRAPPPPPLKLSRPPIKPLPPLPQPSVGSSAVLLTPCTPLSPLNPSSSAGLTRRASEFQNSGTVRPRLARTASSFSHHLPSPRWLSPVPPAASPGPAPTIPLPSPPTRRRLSSMSRPLNAWERKPSYMAIPTLSSLALGSYEEESQAALTSELAHTAWNMLSGALKHYKLALTTLSLAQTDLAERARAKSEVLASIAAVSLFKAALGPRLRHSHHTAHRSHGHPHAHPPHPMGEKEDTASLLTTAEVYATWAAREVGWSFLIEGTPSASTADRRTGTWEADEAGKRAVLLTLRVWWFRATGEGESAESAASVASAKASVEQVVRRLKDLEGVGHGDVARFMASLRKSEGNVDVVEGLFWRSVKRTLRGGEGGVMG